MSIIEKSAKKIWFLYFLDVYLLSTLKMLNLIIKKMIKLNQEKSKNIKGGGDIIKFTPPPAP